MNDPWILFVAASALGALAFFAAGNALGRTRTTTTPAAPPTDDAELVRLRAHHAEVLDDHRRLGDEVARLSAALRAVPPAPQAQPPQQPPAPQAVPIAPMTASITSGNLDSIVRQLRTTPGVESAVVSDELGLLVAGSGVRAEELAALGGYLAGVGERTRQLAALGAPARITIEDEGGAMLSATHLPGGSLVAVTVRAR